LNTPDIKILGTYSPQVTCNVCILVSIASLAHACSIKPPLSLTFSFAAATQPPLTTWLILLLLLLLLCRSFPVSSPTGSIIIAIAKSTICSSSGAIASCCCTTLLPPTPLLLLLRLHSAVCCCIVVRAPLSTSAPKSPRNNLPILALQPWPVPFRLLRRHNVFFNPLPSKGAAAPATTTSSASRKPRTLLLLLLPRGVRLITSILSITQLHVIVVTLMLIAIRSR
jgi:hypothetical protein